MSLPRSCCLQAVTCWMLMLAAHMVAGNGYFTLEEVAEQRLVKGHKAWQMALQENNSEWLQAVEEAKKEIPPLKKYHH